ncbi:MAG: succinylglutamate desuccinylase/aspartoacylase family protein [Methylocystis sp.]|nr:succinylglutamate desuccinylase/aspartoacylase family protein [Methylocystis sp.]MCA3585039.1 succinylglutamate desuccinylase/aspartoacylase family protein [Methylocystis sp.]MCA3592257.1 succinylglutamate desuccinylase/aspartoacylase family protein [Methylocystis sp.]
MRIEHKPIGGFTPGQSLDVAFLHFGEEGARPKAYIQAGLHADEAPGQLAAVHLRRRLEALEAEGRIRGHIVLAPAANPIGLAQHVMGTLHGRFALQDGANFNRGYPDLTEVAAALAESGLTADADENACRIRAAMLAALEGAEPLKPADRLKRILLEQAIDADTILDLHCDGEAEVHLYTLTDQAEAFRPLAGYLNAKAVLVADVSGENPFDEAVSRPWAELRRRYPDLPIPRGAIAATVELRGESDVDHTIAAADAESIVKFLALRGSLTGTPEPAPPACAATPLAGSEALEARTAGLIVFACPVGRHVEAGTLIAEIVDPVSGDAACVHATTSGIFYARTSVRFAVPGCRLGKIAGAKPFRSGDLLSP